MQTDAVQANMKIFLALIILAALIGILGSYLSEGQVVDGELTSWAAEVDLDRWRIEILQH
ncbi:MAG: hypothetical protein JW941_03095 [Candidatus Coatesbacteria bacterium]|nr:hypothetical protein [Candidatus Coatesbacteria bacterium]